MSRSKFRFITSTLFLLLAVFLLPAALTTPAHAAAGSYSVSYTYNILTNEATLSKVTETRGGSYSVPQQSGYRPIISIGSNAFSQCPELTEVILPEGIKTIGSTAFKGCEKLTSITIPSSVTSISTDAFLGCTALKEVHIADADAWYNVSFSTENSNPTFYGAKLFVNGTELTSYTIPSDADSVKNYAFVGCTSLSSVTIPNSVTSLGTSAFRGCKALAEINGAAELSGANVNSLDGTAWLENRPDGLAILGKCLIRAKGNCPAAVVIPEGVKGIAPSAFLGQASLKEITIPGSVTTIGTDAFLGCNGLSAVHISDLTAWCGTTFSDADANPLSKAFHLYLNGSEITELVIPEGVTDISAFAFYGGMYFTSVTVPPSVQSVKGSAFMNCYSLEKVHITDLSAWCGISFVTESSCPLYYAENLYLNGKLVTELDLPADLPSIGKYAFRNCIPLQKLTVNGAPAIGEYAFYDCMSLSEVSVSDSVSSIGSYAFHNTPWFTNHVSGAVYAGKVFYAHRGSSSAAFSLKPDTIGIAGNAFSALSDLTELVIPDSVICIEKGALTALKNLEKLTLPFVGQSLNGESNQHFGYIFNASSYYSNSASVPGTLKEVTVTKADSLGEHAFYACKELTAITLPADCAEIGVYAFYNCTNLASVNLPASLSTLGNYIFYNCENLTDFAIPANCTEIGSFALYSCDKLTSLTIPKSVRTIGNSAFSSCINLTSVEFTGATEHLGKSIFNGCSLLTSVTLPDGITEIPPLAFRSCTSLTDLTIPESVTTIGIGAFMDCKSLSSLKLPPSVTSIGRQAFYGCAEITDIKLPQGLTELASYT
ncbi:MAG: leucine-rich repeat domain-containing protein, partial [Clostridia bacterium]|nr:leucine-rich repeat domain-containing protein [Clostridia bacterium]